MPDEKTVTLTYFKHALPEDPAQEGLVHSEHQIEVPESQAEARVRGFYESDGSTSAHKDDLRRYAPDLLD